MLHLQYNTDRLAEVLNNFNIITGIRMAIFDDKFQEIIANDDKHCFFCKIVQSSPESKLHCIKSNMDSFSYCKENKKILIYKCHAGLYEVTSPLMYKNVIVGYAMLGQILNSPCNDLKINHILSNECKEDVTDLIDSSLRQLVPLSSEKISAAVNIMEACISYIFANEFITFSENTFMLVFDKYIEDNLDSELSVDIICSHFGVSRSKLYRLADHALGIGISEFIRMKRIQKAKVLLKCTSTKIIDISTMIGFNDYNYFCRIFKRDTGMSPKKFRSII